MRKAPDPAFVSAPICRNSAVSGSPTVLGLRQGAQQPQQPSQQPQHQRAKQQPRHLTAAAAAAAAVGANAKLVPMSALQAANKRYVGPSVSGGGAAAAAVAAATAATGVGGSRNASPSPAASLAMLTGVGVGSYLREVMGCISTDETIQPKSQLTAANLICVHQRWINPFRDGRGIADKLWGAHEHMIHMI